MFLISFLRPHQPLPSSENAPSTPVVEDHSYGHGASSSGGFAFGHDSFSSSFSSFDSSSTSWGGM